MVVLYAGQDTIAGSSATAELAATALVTRGVRVPQARSVTRPTLFNQPLELVRGWQRDGYRGVDMETATTLAVAQRFGMVGVSMLVAWGEVLSDRSFLDHADEAIWDAALALVAEQPAA